MTKRAIKLISVSTEEQAKREKVSLEYQSERLDAAAAEHGWTWIDTIAVRGFSRDYYTYQEFVAEAGVKHPDVYRLQEHWKRKDFDILAVYDGSRFGRKKSLFAEVVGRTYDAGAEIYTTKEGLITKANSDFFALLGGYAAEKELTVLKERRASGIRRRAERGLPPTHAPATHKLLYDDKGRVVQMVFDSSQKPFWDDVETLIAAGVSWTSFETVLTERFGHTSIAGVPLAPRTVWLYLRTPSFWGHQALGFRPLKANRKRGMTWMFDPAIEPPAGVTVFRNTHEPVYKGEQAARVIAMLQHRVDVIKGRTRPQAPNRFAGLLSCARCGYNMTYYNSKANKTKYLRCHYSGKNPSPTRCTNTRYIRGDDLQGFMERFMVTALASDAPFVMPTHSGVERLAMLEAEQRRLRQDVDRLIELQIDASSDRLRAQYTEKINARDTRLERLAQDIAVLRNLPQDDTAGREQVRREITEMGGLEAFWSASDREINQRLHRFLKGYRFICDNGEVTELRFKSKIMS